MDNPYYDWSPLPSRPPVRWPDGARLALCVIVCLEHVEWLPPEGTLVPPSVVYMGPWPRVWDIPEVSHHEYGNRVGVFRIMKLLDRHGIRATVAMDAALAQLAPPLVRHCRERNWEFIGHGIAASRMISERMSVDEERRTIRTALDVLEEATGDRPVGWLGADYGESTRTVRLLAEEGVRYVCDWPNDEQPYRMKVPTGSMVSLPVTLELDDNFTHRRRFIPTDRWAEMAIEAFDRLYRDGEQSGRLLVLNLHPWTIGQPFRIKHLERVLEHVNRRSGVWRATGGEIVSWFERTNANAAP
jgi:peptidoglycan/xylan/chitin deacetylase (PgdA/CDA1 family)